MSPDIMKQKLQLLLLQHRIDWLNETKSIDISWYTSDYHNGTLLEEHILSQQLYKVIPDNILLNCTNKHGGIEYSMAYKL